MKTLRFVALLCLALVAFAQTAPPVNQIDGPPGGMAIQKYFAYTGSYLTYICQAASRQNLSTAISVSAATNAAAVEFTSAAHNMNPYAKPAVTIAGGTANWSAVNGTYTATITGANTFTIAVNSTSFGALTGTLTFVTRTPRLNQTVWAVQYFAYDGSNNLVGSFWSGGAISYTSACTTPTQYQ